MNEKNNKNNLWVFFFFPPLMTFTIIDHLWSAWSIFIAGYTGQIYWAIELNK